MFIKPKKEQSKPKQSKPVKLDSIKPEKQKIPVNEFLKSDELLQLSRDYVLEHEGLTILSWDYVIEHGREWADGIGWDSYGYRVCDITGDEEIPINGLLYEVVRNGNFWYGYYEEGLETKEDVTFFPSGKVKRYHDLVNGNYYEWRENGNIRLVRIRNEDDLYLHIAENGKITRLTWSEIQSMRSNGYLDSYGYLA